MSQLVVVVEGVRAVQIAVAGRVTVIVVVVIVLAAQVGVVCRVAADADRRHKGSLHEELSEVSYCHPVSQFVNHLAATGELGVEQGSVVARAAVRMDEEEFYSLSEVLFNSILVAVQGQIHSVSDDMNAEVVCIPKSVVVE